MGQMTTDEVNAGLFDELKKSRRQIKIMREALNKIRKKGNQLSSAVALTALIRTGFKEDIE